jgi:hypothetical protein
MNGLGWAVHSVLSKTACVRSTKWLCCAVLCCAVMLLLFFMMSTCTSHGQACNVRSAFTFTRCLSVYLSVGGIQTQSEDALRLLA